MGALSEAAVEEAFVLVDYDNLGFRRSESKTTEGSVAEDLDEIVDSVTKDTLELLPLLGRVVIRLYGGWTSDTGIPTRTAGILMAHLSSVARRHKGRLRIAGLALGLYRVPATLFGTYRLRPKGICPKCGAVRAATFGEQKMVDMMIGLDLCEIARNTDASVLVFSDDQDLVPALAIAGTDAHGRVFWIRGETSEPGPNDNSLRGCTVTILKRGGRNV